MNTKPKNPQPKAGLAFWMDRVLEECDRAGAGFAPDPVHDLRVALRRCRSLADGLRAIDPDPAWKQMRKAGKEVFSRLGDLRDVQVMEEWTHHFDSPGDPVTSRLLELLAIRESQLKLEAAKALQEFDRKQWRKWSKTLPRRTARLRPGNAVFKHLALEHWMEAHELHRRAIRNRSQVSLHQLRIGLKHFRYIVENFLPQQHEAWGNDLKKLQDLLGEVHDLDVLWAIAQQTSAFPTADDRARWHARILEAREQRIAKYRERMQGPEALWPVWRAQLPQGEQIRALALQRLKLLASFLDPDAKHSQHVTSLALQLYDGLAQDRRPAGDESNQRQSLRLAALLHDVGRSEGEKGHHKTTYRIIRKLTPPLGIPALVLQTAAAVARYHRGALPRNGYVALQGLSRTDRHAALRLAAILRLANALDAEGDGSIRRVQVEDASQREGRASSGKMPGRSQIAVIVYAEGYKSNSKIAQAAAAARYWLETIDRRAVLVRALPVVRKPSTRARAMAA